MNGSFFSKRPGLSIVIVALAAVAGGAIGYVVSSGQPDTYSTTARFIVAPGPRLLASEPRDLVLGVDALNGQSIVPTFAELLGGRALLAEAAAEIGMRPGEAADYEATPVEVPGSAVIDLTVSGPNGGGAAALANAIGRGASTLTGDLFGVYQLRSLEPAQPPITASSPMPARDSLLAAVLAGGLVAFMLVQTVVVLPNRPSVVRIPTGSIGLDDHGAVERR